MATAYHTGIIIVYLGLCVSAFEIVLDLGLKSLHILTRSGLIVFCAYLTYTFTLSVVMLTAPLNPYSYAINRQSYADETLIDGISWNSHFADVRLVLTNPTTDTYRDLNLQILSTSWIHKSVIVSGPKDCALSAINTAGIASGVMKDAGKHHVTVTTSGSSVEAHDDDGNSYTSMASYGGYRLTCGRMPGGESISLLFAIVSKRTDVAIGEAHLLDKTTVSYDDVLGPKPVLKMLDVEGTYFRDFKPFAISTMVSVGQTPDIDKIP